MACSVSLQCKALLFDGTVNKEGEKSIILVIVIVVADRCHDCRGATLSWYGPQEHTVHRLLICLESLLTGYTL